MKNKKGFTMAELLAVIVVLSFLILLAVPKVTSMIEKSRKKSFVNEANTILKTAKMAYADKLDFTDNSGAKVYTVQELKEKRYLEEADDITGCVGIYVDKDTGEATYVVKLAKDGKYYVSTDGTVKDSNIAIDSEGLNAISNNESLESLCRIEAAYKKWWRLIDDKNGNGELDVGDEVKFETEKFYVIGFDGDNVKLFAKYNLDVGYQCANGNITSCSLIENPTGIQDSRNIGWKSGVTGTRGTVAFSTETYWMNDDRTFKSEYERYGNNNYVDVYNDNTPIKEYVDNYSNYLKNIGANVIEARLITYKELENEGCYGSDKVMCPTGKPWLHSTTYWVGSAWYSDHIVRAYIDRNVYDFANYSHYMSFGVKPLIIISRNDIRK